MDFSISNEHGEPTNFGLMVALILSLFMWIMFTVGENNWLTALYKILSLD